MNENNRMNETLILSFDKSRKNLYYIEKGITRRLRDKKKKEIIKKKVMRGKKRERERASR